MRAGGVGCVLAHVLACVLVCLLSVRGSCLFVSDRLLVSLSIFGGM